MVQRIWNKFFNRENVSYLIFGVLTTLADWISYRMMRLAGMDYRLVPGQWPCCSPLSPTSCLYSAA